MAPLAASVASTMCRSPAVMATTSARVAPMASMASCCGAFKASPMRLHGYEGFQVATVKKPAPTFIADIVENGEIKNGVSLQTLLEKNNYVVLVFYPLDFTFVCPTELNAFSDASAQFKELKTQVLGVSVDSVYSHLAWVNQPRNKGGLGKDFAMPLVSDITKNISRDYGVLIEEDGIALRGTFIIDNTGVVRSMTVNDLGIGRSVEETIRTIQALEKHKSGDVVPCGWKPGKATMDVAKAAEFFAKNN